MKTFKFSGLVAAILIVCWSLFAGVLSASEVGYDDHVIVSNDYPDNGLVLVAIQEINTQQAQHAAKSIFIATIIRPVYLRASDVELMKAKLYTLRVKEVGRQYRLPDFIHT